MTINCAGYPENPVAQEKTMPVEWEEGTRTMLQELAARRAEALNAQAEMYRSVDPLLRGQQEKAAASQQIWESMTFDAGRRAMLNPQKTRNTEAWLANWIGVKSSSMGDIREPILNIKRESEGLLREAGVYNMTMKTREFASTLKSLAKTRGVKLELDDMRRVLEEGMTPQRLAVYGNTPMQTAELTTRFAKFKQDFMARGFTEDDITSLLEKAQPVSQQFDQIQAVAMATGMNVGELHNIGYFPRQLTDDGFAAARLSGALKLDSHDAVNAAFAKSRGTWQYLPEDHALASKLLGVTTDELHALIADPPTFAQFLSSRVKGDNLDLLVDSGVFSKIPMLTSHVEEYMSKVYSIPLVSGGLFQTDPLAAAGQYVRKLQAGVENSAVVKFVESEGYKSGWSLPKQMLDIDPETYKGFVQLNALEQFKHVDPNTYVHPSVAAHLQGIIRVNSDPGELAVSANAYKMFTGWFAKQALGNPITAKGYLFGQFMGNMLAVQSRGVSASHFIASLIDVTKVAQSGLDVLDNVKPFRIIDGVVMTHRETVARSIRMFSRDILPGLSGANLVLDYNEINPVYFVKQLAQLRAAADSTSGFAGEVGKLLGRKADTVLTPSLKIAQLLDLASQVAIVRGKSRLAGSALEQAADATDQLALGWSIGKHDTWENLVLEVKRGMPMFDDLGKIPSVISHFIPFSSWALGNLPLQMKSMMREPSRWANYMRAHALWNSSQIESVNRDTPEGKTGINQAPMNGEMQAWEKDEYGMITQIDPTTRKTHMLFSSQFDPRWGVITRLADLADPTQSAADVRNGTKTQSGAKFLQSLIGNSYFSGIYEAVSGINPQTGQTRDDSPFTQHSFMGVPMPAYISAILSISPVAQSLDRLPFLSGTQAVLDARTGAVIEPAVRSWLGGKGTLKPNELRGVEATAQMMGARIRVIDGLKNMQFTEADTKAAITRMSNGAFKAQKDLAADLKAGTVQRDSPQYAQRAQAIHQMYDTAVQVNLDLSRIQAYAAVNRLPSRDMMQQMRDRNIAADKLPLPEAEYVRQLMQQSAEFKQNTP